MYFEINGVPVFVRGTNWIPPDAWRERRVFFFGKSTWNTKGLAENHLWAPVVLRRWFLPCYVSSQRFASSLMFIFWGGDRGNSIPGVCYNYVRFYFAFVFDENLLSPPFFFLWCFRVSDERRRWLLESAAAANMNMIRVWGGGQTQVRGSYPHFRVSVVRARSFVLPFVCAAEFMAWSIVSLPPRVLSCVFCARAFVCLPYARDKVHNIRFCLFTARDFNKIGLRTSVANDGVAHSGDKNNSSSTDHCLLNANVLIVQMFSWNIVTRKI